MYYCNKCGHMGANGPMHYRRSGGTCGYDALQPAMERGPQDTAASEMARLLDLSARQSAELERLRETMNFIATHFSTDWPERCQSNVLAARRLLGPNVELTGHQRPARKDEK